MPLISTYGVLLVLLLKDALGVLLGGGGALEVGVVDVVWDGNTGHVQLGGGGDDGRGGAATEWDTVDLDFSKLINKFLNLFQLPCMGQ